MLQIDYAGPLERIAHSYAVKMHNKANHWYGNHDYEYHLNMVREFAMKYIEYVHPASRDAVLAACWVHDVIEDCRETYNDVEKVLGKEVADLAYALTNEKGRNRNERANDKYYQEMRKVQYAPFIKICDRLANSYQSIMIEKSSMGKRYHREYPKFKLMLAEPKSTFWSFIFQFNFFRWNTKTQYFLRQLYDHGIKYPRMWKEVFDISNEYVYQNQKLKMTRGKRYDIKPRKLYG